MFELMFEDNVTQFKIKQSMGMPSTFPLMNDVKPARRPKAFSLGIISFSRAFPNSHIAGSARPLLAWRLIFKGSFTRCRTALGFCNQ